MQIISHGNSLNPETSDPTKGAHDDVRAVIEAFRQFELGRFLLENLGLNGYWTSYILLHPDQGRLSGQSSDGSPLTELESWLLDRCPIFLATQERFRIFKQLTQPLLRSSMDLASIPCGRMDDLLSLDYSGIRDVRLTGVDLDQNSLSHAERNDRQLKPEVSISFELKDAWALHSTGRWDLVTSNGLNIYVQEDEQCGALYQSFAASLKPKGFLLVSFITPPATWVPKRRDDLAYQRFLFTEVLPVKWQCVRTEETTRAQLQAAGLEVLTVEYDSQRMFPSVLAQKKQQG